MKFYLTIIKDVNEMQKLLDQIESGIIVADKQMFVDSLNQLEQTIKIIKDKCNEENKYDI